MILEAESIEEGVAVEPKITKKKPRVMQNSLSHQVGNTRKDGPPES
jgi:hypothetical protein